MSKRNGRIPTVLVALAVLAYAGWAWYSASPVRSFAKAIRNGDPERKATAIHEMAQVVATPTDVDFAVPLLIDGLNDPVMEVRVESAQALGLFYNLWRQNRKGEVDIEAALAMRRPAVAAALERSLRDPEPFVRQTALSAYLGCNPTDGNGPVPPMLRALMDDPGEGVRAMALKGLRIYDGGLEILLQAGLDRFGSEGPVVQSAIGNAFERAKFRPEHLPLLSKMMNGPDDRLRRMAISAISRMGPSGAPAIPSLVAFVRRGMDEAKSSTRLPPSVYEFGVSALGALVEVTPEDASGTEAVALLREFLSEPRYATLHADVAYWLAVLGPPARPASPDVLRVFESLPSPSYERYQVARSLARLAKGSEFEPVVINAMARAWKANPDPRENAGVYEALIELRPDSEAVLPEVRTFSLPRPLDNLSFRRGGKYLVESPLPD